MHGEPVFNPARGWRQSLRLGALLVSSTFAALVVANLFVGFYLLPAPPVTTDPHRILEATARGRADAAVARYGMEPFRRVYLGKSDDEIRAFLRSQAVIETMYEPFAEFRLPARVSSGSNIHEAGFRWIGAEQGPWPLASDAVNVFVFGGSTTLGGGVRDDETIPAFLQKLLRQAAGAPPVNIYNFGVGSFFSSQEVTYFQNQLRYGNIPDVVIFIDGLNDFYFWEGRSAVSEHYRDALGTIHSLNAQLGRDRGFLWHLGELFRALPLVRLAQRTTASAAPASVASRGTGLSDDPPDLADPERLAAVIDRYLVNHDVAASVARGFGIEPIFVWQPIPLYKYDTTWHPFEVPERHRLSKYGYPMMARLTGQHALGPSFIWCADLQETLHEPLYVDAVHYTPSMSRRVAECVTRGVVASGALARAAATKLEAPRSARISARALLASRREHSVAHLFGSSAQTTDLTVDGELDSAKTSRLADDSPQYASVFEDIPLTPSERSSTYRVSLLIRAGTSTYSQLVMQFLGERSETYQVFFNSRSMQTILSRGIATLEPTASGWYRLSLSGRAPGAERLRIHLFPRHGAAEDTGDLQFGGGEVWVEADPEAVSAGVAREP